MSTILGKLLLKIPKFRFPPLPEVQHRTISFRILALISLIVVPLMLLFAWATLHIASLNRQVIELEQTDVTHRVSAAVDRRISGLLGLLTGLAANGDLSNDNIVNFERHANSLLKSDPYIIRIWAFNKDGASIASTGLGQANRVILTDGTVVSKVFAGNQVVSDVNGEGPGKANVTIALPVRTGNTIAFGLAADYRVAQLSILFSSEGMKSDWAAAVVDRDGRFVGRSHDTANRLGELARPELGKAARAPQTTGTFENVTYEGVHMANVYHRSPVTDWTTVMAVPYQKLQHPIRRVIFLLVLVALTVLAATLAMTSFLAIRISQPVRDLGLYARSLTSGKSYIPSRHSILELDEVRTALDNAVAQSARLASLVASSGDAIISADIDGTIRSWNVGAERLLGFPEEEIIGQPKTLIVPDNRLDEYNAWRDLVLKGQIVNADTQRRHKDGSIVEVSVNSAPIRKPDGEIFALSSILHDISDRKVAEEHKTFLMRELAHRCRNQLAIIQAIAKQTARGTTSPEEFLRNFGKRLQGLSASHDLLARQEWTSVSLLDLVRSQLSVFVEWPSERVSADGPMIPLQPGDAEVIGLALHELATNAAKYGALSVPGGRINIKWTRMTDSDTSECFRIFWQETDGPSVVAPEHKGFGTQVIESMVAQSVNGTADIEYHPGGLRWSLEWPTPNADPNVEANVAPRVIKAV